LGRRLRTMWDLIFERAKKVIIRVIISEQFPVKVLYMKKTFEVKDRPHTSEGKENTSANKPLSIKKEFYKQSRPQSLQAD